MAFVCIIVYLNVRTMSSKDNVGTLALQCFFIYELESGIHCMSMVYTGSNAMELLPLDT